MTNFILFSIYTRSSNIELSQIKFKYLKLFMESVRFETNFSLMLYGLVNRILDLTNFGGYIFNFEYLVTFLTITLFYNNKFAIN